MPAPRRRGPDAASASTSSPAGRHGPRLRSMRRPAMPFRSLAKHRGRASGLRARSARFSRDRRDRAAGAAARAGGASVAGAAGARGTLAAALDVRRQKGPARPCGRSIAGSRRIARSPWQVTIEGEKVRRRGAALRRDPSSSIRKGGCGMMENRAKSHYRPCRALASLGKGGRRILNRETQQSGDASSGPGLTKAIDR